MSQQSLRQASIRAVTSTTYTYEGDWHALWDLLGIAAGQFNERMLAYINNQLSASYTELNGAMAAFAAEHGSTTFQAIGTFTPGFSLTAPVLAFASATDPDSDNTQDLDADIAVALGSNVIRLVGTFGSATVSAPYDVDTTGTDGDLDQNIPFTTGAIDDGVCSFKCRIETAGGAALSDWSNTVSKTVDTTAPTVTSSNAINQAENAAFSHTLTANETVTWTKTGGADTALFTLAGSNLSMTAKDYETPADADTNNTYVVQVTATDTAGNATNQTITVTVTNVGEGPSAEVQQYLDRATGMDGTHVSAFTALIDGLVADSIWTKLDALYVLATDTSAHALLNVKSSSFALLSNGSPTFTADQGYTGTAGSTTVYLDTQFIPFSAGGNFTQNSAHISAWSNTNPAAADNLMMGGRTGTDFVYFYPRKAAGTCECAINSASNAVSTSVATSQGHYIVNRSASNAFQLYKDGASIASDTDASSALFNEEIFILGYNNNGSAALGAANQVSAASIGGSLSGTEMTALYNRLATYRTAVGL